MEIHLLSQQRSPTDDVFLLSGTIFFRSETYMEHAI